MMGVGVLLYTGCSSSQTSDPQGRSSKDQREAVIVRRTDPPTHFSDFLDLFTNGLAFSDVIFSVEGRHVRVHRCILAARSTFFRMHFCKGGSLGTVGMDSSFTPLHISVDAVSYDVFMVVLRFLYSGELVLIAEQGRFKCSDRVCAHAHCTYAVELAVGTLHAANYFGVDQLSVLTQRHLESMVEKMTIDDCMRLLVSAKTQGLGSLWGMCAEVVAQSGLAVNALSKHLPMDLLAEIGKIRIQKGIQFLQRGELEGSVSARSTYEQWISRMRRALDAEDLELVRLMVIGEGLDLDKAQALHYAVTNCSRDVVKALLEMGIVDVNYAGPASNTALHLAAEMGNPDMISVLLDHHASPRIRLGNGDTPAAILQALIFKAQCRTKSRGEASSPTCAYNKIRLCLELLNSAVYIADKEDALSGGAVTKIDTRWLGWSEVQDGSSAVPIMGISNELQPQHSDWASVESSCSFEHEDGDSVVRLMATRVHSPSWMSLDGLSMSMDFQVAGHGEVDSKLVTTIF